MITHLWSLPKGNARKGGENLSYRRSGDLIIYGIPYRYKRERETRRSEEKRKEKAKRRDE